MGRKPNPIIATHFIRGNKHGQTTNRYAQTCGHCGLHFPTGRPETLLTHLVSCPMLNSAERAEIIHRMYNTSATTDTTSSSSLPDHQRSGIHNITHNDDFDITGLNVLAGAAENAEDLAIDPHMTDHEPTPQTTAAGGQPLPFYDNHYGSSYQNSTSNHPWPFQFTTMHDPPSPFPDLPSVSGSVTAFSTAALPVTHWSFAPVITAPMPYALHSDHQGPVAFADQHGNHIMQSDECSGTSLVDMPSKHKARKSREPYNEPKRARVAEMRQVGACIRCSRLRKNCDPRRPCELCSKTAAKTWIGGCTSLNKGQEFSIWFDTHFSMMYTKECRAHAKETRSEDDAYFDDKLQLTFFGEGGPMVCFDLGRVYAERTKENDGYGHKTRVSGKFAYIYSICEREDIVHKIHEHARDHQELILDTIDSPAICTTARIAQGLSSRSDSDADQIWGTGKQADERLRSVFELWLIVTLITNEKLSRKFVVSNNTSTSLVNDVSSGVDWRTILSMQLDTVLDKYPQTSQEELRKFDANILNQSYKHLFNLVIGMFLILDAIERYCCFLKSKKCTTVDYATMVEQAQTLAYKYTYCVHNIPMMPKMITNEDGLIVAEDKHGKIDHDMQKLWVAELCISESDLKEYLNQESGDDWTVPTGRLWAKLFAGLIID